jgi:hypothetical protein
MEDNKKTACHAKIIWMTTIILHKNSPNINLMCWLDRPEWIQTRQDHAYWPTPKLWIIRTAKQTKA